MAQLDAAEVYAQLNNSFKDFPRNTSISPAGLFRLCTVHSL